MTTVFDVAGEGSAKACWVLMRRAKRTSLSPQALPRNLRSFSRLPVTAPKNRTRIGPHLGRRKMTLFSPKTGYVRRSESRATAAANRSNRGRGQGDEAMRLDDLPESGNIEDRRGEGGYGGGGGGGFGLPIGGGGLGIGTIVVLGIVGWALGIDPSLLIGGAEVLTRPSQPQAPPIARRSWCSTAARRAPSAAGRRRPRWGRSIVRLTRRSISTPRSSIRSRPASAAATSAARRANSRRLM